ncbi:Uncharacterised protein [Vibrio cholerae]|nr:Uncharacterised protein [Vibrio cholerae]
MIVIQQHSVLLRDIERRRFTLGKQDCPVRAFYL